MKHSSFFVIGVIAGVALTLVLIVMAPGHSSPAALANAGRAATTPLAANLAATSTPMIPAASGAEDDELAPASLAESGAALAALPTPVPGETQLFFAPTDNDATATVLFLYNTDSVTRTVALRGFSYNGVLVYSLNIEIGPTSFKRLASDSIAAAPPPSWATPAPVITNFTDFTYFASLSLPRGVKAEGYTLFNPGTGVVDPRQDQGAIPLRFSTDPATLFLPEAQR